MLVDTFKGWILNNSGKSKKKKFPFLFGEKENSSLSNYCYCYYTTLIKCKSLFYFLFTMFPSVLLFGRFIICFIELSVSVYRFIAVLNSKHQRLLLSSWLICVRPHHHFIKLGHMTLLFWSIFKIHGVTQSFINILLKSYIPAGGNGIPQKCFSNDIKGRGDFLFFEPYV